jgi:hypothetical protein
MSAADETAEFLTTMLGGLDRINERIAAAEAKSEFSRVCRLAESRDAAYENIASSAGDLLAQLRAEGRLS